LRVALSQEPGNHDEVPGDDASEDDIRAAQHARATRKSALKRNQQNQELGQYQTRHRADGHEHVNQRVVFGAPQAQRYNGRRRIGDLQGEKDDQNINHRILAQHQADIGWSDEKLSQPAPKSNLSFQHPLHNLVNG
jgi:hypothetical protein